MMKDAEQQFVQFVEETILNASPKELAHLQQLDIKTQLGGLTFYDVFLNHSHKGIKKENFKPNPNAFDKPKSS